MVKYVHEQWQCIVDKLCIIVVMSARGEIFEHVVRDRSASHVVSGGQRLVPGIQRPGYTKIA